MPADLKTMIAGHHSFFHGTETITHRPMNPPGPDQVPANGHKGAATQERMALFGISVAPEDVVCVWEVWGLTTIVNVGDELITAAGLRYKVLGRLDSHMTTRQECACLLITGN